MPDQEDWNPTWLKIVRGVYATLVGSAVIIVALQLLPHLVEDGNLTMVEAVLGGGLIAGGLLVAVPWVSMPALSSVFKFLRKNGP